MIRPHLKKLFLFISFSVGVVFILILILRGTNRELIISWDESSGATYYEVLITWIGPASETQHRSITTKKTSIKVTRPKAGHFKAKVKACNNYSAVNGLIVLILGGTYEEALGNIFTFSFDDLDTRHPRLPTVFSVRLNQT